MALGYDSDEERRCKFPEHKRTKIAPKNPEVQYIIVYLGVHSTFLGIQTRCPVTYPQHGMINYPRLEGSTPRKYVSERMAQRLEWQSPGRVRHCAFLEAWG